MRPQPLADLKSLDLSREVVPIEEFQRHVLQRGNFALVDGVCHVDVEGELIVGYKEIRKDDWWARDHIPGRPLFPGTLMVEAGAQLSTYDYIQRRPEITDAFVGFAGIDNVRYRAIVEPDCRLWLISKPTRVRKSVFYYRIQGMVDDAIVFEGDITGMVI